jgi:t-SNARE complex subunit (syntaxin)
MNEGIKSVLGMGGIIAGAVTGAHTFDQRVDRIKELADNPDALSAQTSNHIDSINQNLPKISQGIATTLAASAQYLNSVMPKPNANKLPLSHDLKVPEAQKQKFNRIYDAVNDPISVLKDVKSGTLILDQVKAIQSTHPELYNEMKKRMVTMANPNTAKNLPYHTKQSIALFLGTGNVTVTFASKRLGN